MQLYSSMDFGRKWQLVHDNVMPGRFYWYDYVDPIFELLSTATDCNLCNDSVHDLMLSEVSSDLLSKPNLLHSSQAQNWLSMSRRLEGILCLSFHSTNMTCCFCCCCRLVILTAQAQGSEYWCKSVYPCLSSYVSKPSVFFRQDIKDIAWRTFSQHTWTMWYLMKKKNMVDVCAIFVLLNTIPLCSICQIVIFQQTTIP